MSPEGRPNVKFGGTWSFIKGTGKWENVQGEGTYKGMFIGPGIFLLILLRENTLLKNEEQASLSNLIYAIFS